MRRTSASKFLGVGLQDGNSIGGGGLEGVWGPVFLVMGFGFGVLGSGSEIRGRRRRGTRKWRRGIEIGE